MMEPIQAVAVPPAPSTASSSVPPTTVGPPRCRTHPNQDAIGVCADCSAETCRVCTMFQGDAELCPGCARKRRRRSGLVRSGLVTLLLGAAAAGGYIALTRRTPSGVDRLARYGTAAGEIKNLEDGLTREPCDRAQILKLADMLIRNGDPRSAIERVDAFLSRCGDYPRLSWTKYTAHKQLSEWDAAIVDATRLIEHQPDDKDYWWWRGSAYEQKGDLDKAAADYRQTLALRPDITGIPFNLANLYERMNKPCEAILPLQQFVQYHPDAPPTVRQRIDRLYANEECAAMAGSGRAVVRFAPGAVVLTRAKVNGKAGTFIVDTGASFVALSPRFAQKAGVDAAHWSALRVQTAAGMRQAKVGVVDDVALEGVRASRVEAAILEEDLEHADGLLGTSFLARFTMELDHGKGTLALTSRAKP